MLFYKNLDTTHLVISTEEFNCKHLQLLTPNTTDGAHEKHVPFIKVDGSNINVVVGEVKHPMLENHYIEAIIIETNKQLHVKELKPGDDPVFNITLESDEKPLRVLEYCNLHGLWGVEL